MIESSFAHMGISQKSKGKGVEGRLVFSCPYNSKSKRNTRFFFIFEEQTTESYLEKRKSREGSKNFKNLVLN